MRTLAAILTAAFPLALWAEIEDPSLSAKMADLERQIGELRESRAKPRWPRIQEPAGEISGLGLLASKVYFDPDDAPWSFGLGAEFFSYEKRNENGASGSDRTNVTALTPLIAFRPHPRLLFNAQLAFRNGGAESSETVTLRKGEAVVQMAYLDWFSAATPVRSGLRLGHQLIPIGTANVDDPTSYFGVERPDLERELIPSLWHENGLLLWTERPKVSLQAGIFNSLNSAGFRKDGFLAGGRSQGQNAPAEDAMGAVRIIARGKLLALGISSAFGNSAQNNASVRAGGFQIGEAHLRMRLPRLDALFLAAHGMLQEADAVSIMNNSVIARQAKGWYGQLALDLLGGNQRLWVFLRHSRFNLHDRVPDAMSADPNLSKTITSLGLSYYPLPGLVLKADYGRVRTAGTFADDRFSLGAGIIF